MALMLWRLLPWLCFAVLVALIVGAIVVAQEPLIAIAEPPEPTASPSGLPLPQSQAAPSSPAGDTVALFADFQQHRKAPQPTERKPFIPHHAARHLRHLEIRTEPVPFLEAPLSNDPPASLR